MFVKEEQIIRIIHHFPIMYVFPFCPLLLVFCIKLTSLLRMWFLLDMYTCTPYPCILCKTSTCKGFQQISYMSKLSDRWIKHTETWTLICNQPPNIKKKVTRKNALRGLPSKKVWGMTNLIVLTVQAATPCSLSRYCPQSKYFPTLFSVWNTHCLICDFIAKSAASPCFLIFLYISHH